MHLKNYYLWLTYENNKKGTEPSYDCKLYVQPNSTDSLSLNHYRIKTSEKENSLKLIVSNYIAPDNYALLFSLENYIFQYSINIHYLFTKALDRWKGLTAGRDEWVRVDGNGNGDVEIIKDDIALSSTHTPSRDFYQISLISFSEIIYLLRHN